MLKSLSIIYPVYNEENRLKKTFMDIKKFEILNKYINKEYIFVDDGSTDQSVNVIKKNFQKKKNVKILSYKKNRGKGFAIKKGVETAKNQWIVTSDADSSVSLFQLSDWIKKKYLDSNFLIFFASRNHKLSVVKKKYLRQILGIMFKFLINIVLQIKISDTQCGFKLYKENVAKKIFKKLRVYDYMYDVEVCLIAKNLKEKIKILPVKWTHVDGSKINFLKDLFKVLISLVKIFITHKLSRF